VSQAKPPGSLDRFLHQALVDEQTRLFRWVHHCLIFLILYSVAIVMLETVEDFAARHSTFFWVSEQVVVVVFIAEYIGRVRVARPRRSYVLSRWGLIDLIAILPSVSNLLYFTGLPLARVDRLLRVLRFLRVLRVLKLTKRMASDFEESKERRFGTLRLDLQIYFTATFTVLVICSTLIYFAEHGEQPDAFSSIPKSMWWGVSVLSKLGCAGMSPVTILGKAVAALTSFSGLALFGVLMGVVSKTMVAGLYGSQGSE
jgi:voltage-gated potassium channel